MTELETATLELCAASITAARKITELQDRVNELEKENALLRGAAPQHGGVKLPEKELDPKSKKKLFIGGCADGMMLAFAGKEARMLATDLAECRANDGSLPQACRYDYYNLTTLQLAGEFISFYLCNTATLAEAIALLFSTYHHAKCREMKEVNCEEQESGL